MVAIATNSPDRLPEPTQRPVFDLDAPQALADWLLAQSERFEYRPEVYA